MCIYFFPIDLGFKSEVEAGEKDDRRFSEVIHKALESGWWPDSRDDKILLI